MGKKLIAGQNDLASQRPHLSKSWQELKNLPLTPESVTYGSSLKVWWICELGHEWEAVISNRAKGVGCPYCAGKRVQIGYNDLQTLKPKAAT